MSQTQHRRSGITTRQRSRSSGNRAGVSRSGMPSHRRRWRSNFSRAALNWIYRPTPWHMPGVIHHPALRAAAARTPRDDAIQVSYDQADLFFTDHPGYKIGYTMLEVDGLPREWVAACNAMDEIWTPGRWGATVFADAGVTRPIVVMPLGTIRRVFALMARRIALPGDSPSSRSSNGVSAKRRRCCCAPMQQRSRDAMMCCWCCA